MSNIPPYPRSGISDPSLASIQHLQRYIVELTNYINDNHRKYNHNMQTLKDFYDEQVDTLTEERNTHQDQVAVLNNQVAALQGEAVGSKKKVEQMKEQLEVAREEQEVTREKLLGQRHKIDEIYKEMAQLREEWQSKLDLKSQQVNSVREQNQLLKNQISSKDNEISNLNDQVYELTEKINERYSLPEKIKDVEKDHAKIQITLDGVRAKCRQVEQKLDFKEQEVDKLRKENETLRIAKGKYNAEKALEVEEASKKIKTNLQHRIKTLETEQQSHIFQLSESEAKIKRMAQEIGQLEEKVRREKESNSALSQEIKSQDKGKDAYISQFDELKSDYEGVIQRLEDTLTDYQKKNWGLQQENKDLNGQLEDLRELLEEVKAINSLQPARKEYRTLAEMELLAKRQANEQARSTNKRASTGAVSREEDKAGDELEGDWARLMTDIERISA